MARILIIDDVPAILRTYGELLRAEGHIVHTAGSIAEARDLAARIGPEVVICDLELREGNTMEFVGELRATLPEIRPIMITGSPSIDAVAAGIRGGIRDYLAKPVSREELLRAVTLAVREHSLAVLARRLGEENDSYRRRLEELVAAGTADLQAVLVSLLESRDAERIRLASSLHDGLGQDLSALRLQLQTLAGALVDQPELAEAARQLADQADRLVKEVRDISREQNPLLLRGIGFPDALAALAARRGATLEGIPEPPAGIVEPDGLGRVFLVIEEGLALATATRGDVCLSMPAGRADAFRIAPFPEPAPDDIDWLLFRERAWAAGVGLSVEESAGTTALFIEAEGGQREAAWPASS